jgi:hypothetical protein
VPEKVGQSGDESATSIRPLSKYAVERLSFCKPSLDMPHLSRLSLERRHYDFIKPTTRSMKILCSKTFTETSLKEAVRSSQNEYRGKHTWSNFFAKSHSLSSEDINLDEPCLPKRSPTKQHSLKRWSKSCNDLHKREKALSLSTVSKTVQELLSLKLHQDCQVPIQDQLWNKNF